jgi:hypothetical protein
MGAVASGFGVASREGVASVRTEASVPPSEADSPPHAAAKRAIESRATRLICGGEYHWSSKAVDEKYRDISMFRIETLIAIA